MKDVFLRQSTKLVLGVARYQLPVYITRFFAQEMILLSPARPLPEPRLFRLIQAAGKLPDHHYAGYGLHG